MGKKERSVTLFLEEIMDAMEKILRFVRAYDEERFTSDEVMSDAVIKNLMIIGELPATYEDMQSVMKDIKSK